ncbi:MAG: glycosyl hydrolase, partial [Candidatus Omnitrophica bacterium]|nr:glycosyl hydrolase [Candidatus Omnitrophota bacterium]
DDLKKAWKEEKKVLASWREPKGYDQYGGYKLAGWKEKATGFFRVVKRNGFWWLISPEGNPCFYLGLDTAPNLVGNSTPVSDREFLFEWLPSKEGIYKECWARGVWGTSVSDEYVSFDTANLIRKYGDDWKKIATDLTKERLKKWGFSGVGKWGGIPEMSYLPVLRRGDVPKIVQHPDIFDSNVEDKFKESIRRQIEAKKNNPFVVGWSLGNESDEIIKKDEIKKIMEMGPNVPIKKALIDYALKEIYKGDIEALAKSWKLEGKKEEIYEKKPIPPDNDIEKMRIFYAEEYYKFIYKTVKEIDPNHLYFGFWIVPRGWESEDDWRVSVKYCDVIGYDFYSFEFMPDWLKKLVEETGKPIILGEFSFPAFYDGKRGFGCYRSAAKDDADSGQLYTKWMKDAANNPYCVGVSWHFYRDQPVTGRGPGRGEDLVYGEYFAIGMVDVGDRPKWDLVRKAREANLSAIKWRLKAGH